MLAAARAALRATPRQVSGPLDLPERPEGHLRTRPLAYAVARATVSPMVTRGGR